MTRVRDPARDPRPGDVVDFKAKDVFGVETQFQYGVVERTPRRVSVLLGTYSPETGGMLGGSPSWIPTATWRSIVAVGRVTVRAEEGFVGWGAVRQSWCREVQVPVDGG